MVTRHHETKMLQGRHHRTIQVYKRVDIMDKRSMDGSTANLYRWSSERDWIDSASATATATDPLHGIERMKDDLLNPNTEISTNQSPHRPRSNRNNKRRDK